MSEPACDHIAERRSSMFFNSDLSAGADELAYKLGGDYGLTDHQTADLAVVIESAVLNWWPDR